MVSLVSSASSQTGQVTDALRQASQQTGVSFDYLLRTASKESSLNPDAKATTSSASGLFQFIEQTWLSIVKEAGAKFGFGREADAINRQPNGRLTVSDSKERQRILSLRNDPGASAVFGAAFTQRNVDHLSRDLGRAPDQGEAYLAHVLGANGAGRFLALAQKYADAPAAASFAEAAEANPGIFYQANGQPRSFREVQQQLTRGYGNSVSPILAAQESSQSQNAGQGSRQDGSGVFQSLFQTDGRGPVSTLVQSLWGQAGGVTSFAARSSAQGFFPSLTRPNFTTAGTSHQPAPSSTQPAANLASDAEARSSGAVERERTALPLPRPGVPFNLLQFIKARG